MKNITIYFLFSFILSNEIYCQIPIKISIDQQLGSNFIVTIDDSLTNPNWIDEVDSEPGNIFILKFDRDSLIDVKLRHRVVGLMYKSTDTLKSCFKGMVSLNNNEFKLTFYYADSYYNKPFFVLLNGILRDNKIILTDFNLIRNGDTQYIYLVDKKGEKIIFKDSYYILSYSDYEKKMKEWLNGIKRK